MHGGKTHRICGTRIILLMTDNEITFRIRGAIFDVYNELGPGLLESIYEEALIFALKKSGAKRRTTGICACNISRQKITM